MVERHQRADHGGYIRGLDGLRALAVGAVIIYHVAPGFMQGGFLGVDVFFVVSGFLITTLLLRELRKTNRLDLKKFWVRRARRLIPALVVLVITVVPIAALIHRDLLVGIGRQVAGALTFSSNWLEIAHGSSYFDNTSPLLFKNFWSLAVEEQFYLFWPLLFILVMALARHWKARVGIALGLAVLSAVLMGVLAGGDDFTRVYYGTDTHLFGLALGVALAFSWSPANGTWLASTPWQRYSWLAGPLALLGLLALMFFLSDQSLLAYRGGILLASILTAIVIASMLSPASVLANVGENRVLSWIGTRSYGLYLWHWPVLVMVRTLFPTAINSAMWWMQSVLAVVVTGVICEASHRYVETPVRQRGFRDIASDAIDVVRRRVLPQTAVASVVALLVLGTTVAVATAPAKSSVQLDIEKNEAALESEPAAEASNERGDIPPGPEEFDPSMPSGEEVTAIGDSIIVTSKDGLDAALPGINYLAKSNRQWYEAPDLVYEGLKAGEIRRAVILDFGTNAGVTDEAVVREVIDMLGENRMIILVNLYSPSTFIESSNELLASIAADYPNVRIADWHRVASADPSLLQSDVTHPNIDGMHAFASTVMGTMASFETPSE